MKTICMILLVIALGVGAVAINEHHKVSAQQAELAALHQQLEDETNQFKAIEIDRQQWQRRQQDMLGQIDVLAAQVMANRAAESNKTAAAALAPASDATSNLSSTTNANAKKSEAGFGKMVANMMKDPAMRQFIRDQQRTMVDQLYSPFVKKIGLSPEDADKFKDLIADNMVSGAEKGAAMFDGGDPAKSAEALKSMQADQKANEQKIHDFLGDDSFAQYQEYQKTASERMQLNAFRQQAGSDYSLTDQQTDQLLSFMSEEKQAATANGQTPPDQSQRQAGLQAALSDDQTEKLLQTQESINQRVYDRAQAILSPDQLTAFGKFQKSQLQMMRMGMSMARKMFGNDATPAPTPAPSGQ